MRTAHALFDRIGGPSAVTLRGLAIVFIPSLIPTIIYDSSLNGTSPVAWGFVGAVGTLVGAIPILGLGHLFLPRTPRAPRPFVAMAVFASGGVLRGITIGLLSVNLNLATSPQLFFRISGGIALAICWFSLAAIIVDAWSRHREVVTDLERRRLHAIAERDAARESLRATREHIRTTLLTQVTAILSLLSVAVEGGSDTAGIRRAARAMHTTVSDVVRPLSHEMTTPRSRDHLIQGYRIPRLSARDWTHVIAVDALTIDPFHPMITALVVTPSSLPAAIKAYGPFVGTAGAACIGFFAWLVLTLARRVRERRPIVIRTWSWTWAVAVYILMGLTCALVPTTASVLSGGTALQGWLQGGQVLALLTPLAALGAAIMAAEDRRRRIAERERESSVTVLEWSSRRVQQESWAASHRLARELHSGIQSELTAAALRLEWWAQRPDPDAWPSVLDQVKVVAQHVAELIDEATDPPVTDPRGALVTVADVWQGIATVTISVTEEAHAAIARDPATTETLVEVVREGLGNAMRHGRASLITVSVDLEDSNSVDIHVKDNGRGLSASSTPGMGSRVLDDVCLSWDRRSTPNGTLLTARIPVRREETAEEDSDTVRSA